ncbi:HHIP-like protein 1 [Littorina saxatilis]|uniref:Glucose/Sorbosone dehydrogenase domain-containing protein n=1 Tax=Littorina saxatilis TaxID=31220 RepID=A0AAN9BCD1_9CAEN
MDKMSVQMVFVFLAVAVSFTEVTAIGNSVNYTWPCMCLEKVAEDLYNPVEYITFKRDNSVLVLIAEQKGTARAWLKDMERDTLFMNITDRVHTSEAQGEERGLLSVVLHPLYNESSSGRVFVYYVASESGHSHFAYVSEFHATDDVVDPSTEQRLLRVKQPSDTANGGQLLFGDDGYLYIFLGAGAGHDDDQAGNAQNPTSFLGKALRIDVNARGFERGDSGSGLLYEVPGSNPFYDRSLYRPEIFALGFRNPWRCSVDSASRGGSGDIYCGDVGSDQFEEINKIRRGRNYGWNLKEGNVCFHSNKCDDLEDEREPIFTYPYDHDSSKGSAVVGGHVYRGKAFPDLYGGFIYGDAVTGKTFSLKENIDGRYNSTEWSLCPKNMCPCNAREVKKAYLLAFGLDVTAEVMLLMSSQFSALEPEGTLFRVIAPTGTTKNPVTCGTCGLMSSTVLPLLLTIVVFLLNYHEYQGEA